MIDYDALIKWLRVEQKHAKGTGASADAELMNQAASAITSLRDENTTLRRMVENQARELAGLRLKDQSQAQKREG